MENVIEQYLRSSEDLIRQHLSWFKGNIYVPVPGKHNGVKADTETEIGTKIQPYQGNPGGIEFPLPEIPGNSDIDKKKII